MTSLPKLTTVPKRPRTLVALAALVVAAGLVVPGALVWRSGDAARADASAAPTTAAYYDSVQMSMTPLVAHVREFPTAVDGLINSDAAVSPRLAESTDQWGNDYATARDLVRRLTPPAGPRGQQAARLYETGTMLYAEAARAASAAARASVPAERKSTAAQSKRLYTLGDRMFDSAFRVLNADGALTPSVMRFPAAVPGDPDTSQVPVGPTARGSRPSPIPLAEWLDSHAGALAQVANLVRSRSVVRPDLEAGQRLISAPVAGVEPQEAVTGLRLAALVQGETDAASTESRIPGQEERLSLMAGRVWNSALAFLDSAHAFDEGALAVTASAPDSVLYVGGAFDGRPPPLNPGDPVDHGLPGGLPTLDPMSLIGR